MENPLLRDFPTPFQCVPFNEIQQAHFKPAILEAIAQAKQEVEAIANSPAVPSFENTCEALERAGHRLGIVSSTFFNLDSAETNDEMQALAQELAPLIAEYQNDVMLNQALFERVQSVYKNTPPDALTPEQARLLEKQYNGFARQGARLSDADKQTLREIDRELATLTMKFSQNVLQETNDYILHLTTERELAGLPPSIIQAAREEAEKRKLSGWAFTLHYPSYVPFLKYAENRKLRQEIHFAAASRAFKDNERNNESIIRQIVALRAKRAKLLGFDTHAAFVLEERMASTPATVMDFLQDLLTKAKPHALADVQKLQTMAKADGIDPIMPYDHAFYAEKLRIKEFDLDEETLRPYFSLNRVIDAAFALAQRLFGLTFVVRDDVPVYHPEVTTYEVMENGEHKALLYTDWHPREGKRPGAWMTSYRDQYRKDGENIRPHISIVCNFSRPTEDAPSLLTFQEVTTLFHEFGHALHGILADTTYESLSGTNVYWDFVELPSQFLENYCYDKEFIQSFAIHHQSGEPLPAAQIDKIVAAANFMEGYQTMRQLSFGLLDMAYHTGRLAPDASVERFELDTLGETMLYPHIAGTAQSPSFSHIFAGGYAAGYYSYKWAEVLDADAFDYFRQTGIFNPETAAKFKKLLRSGGTVDPMQLYVEFRGREPKPDALLKRAGLVKAG